MKTSLNTAAIRCAAFGRIAGRAGKLGMDTLMRQSYLSVLQESTTGSIPAGLPGIGHWSFRDSTLTDLMSLQGKPRQAMLMPSCGRHDSDSRIPGKRRNGNVMRAQETLATLALAVA